MAKVKLSDAPGCIGSSLIRKEGHPICKNCAFTNVCAQLAARNAVKLAAELGVEKLSGITGRKLEKGAEKLSIKEIEKASGKRLLSKKGEALKKKIEKAISAEDLQRNISSDTGNRSVLEHGAQKLDDWVKQLLLLIWDNNGLINKSELSAFLIHEMGVAKVSASTNAQAFVNALVHMDVLTESKTKVEVFNASSDG